MKHVIQSSAPPKYKKNFLEFMGKVRQGQNVRLTCFFRNSRKGVWEQVDAEGTVLRVGKEDFNVSGIDYAIRYARVHDWEILNETA